MMNYFHVQIEQQNRVLDHFQDRPEICDALARYFSGEVMTARDLLERELNGVDLNGQDKYELYHALFSGFAGASPLKTYAYEPQSKTRGEVIEHFKDDVDMLDRLRNFFLNPTVDTGTELLKGHFHRPESNDINEETHIENLKKVTSCFADKRTSLSITNSILADEALLERVAAQSYPHPIGFDKLVLFACPEFKFRHHIYWRSHDHVDTELTHLHIFEMASALVFGRLRNAQFKIIGYDADEDAVDVMANLHTEKATPEEIAGGVKVVHAYSGYFKDENGVLHKKHLGTVMMVQRHDREYITGQTYGMNLTDAHYVATNSESGAYDFDFTDTYYIHGAKLCDNQGREIAVLFEDHRLPEGDKIIPRIPPMDKEYLRDKLERYAVSVEASLAHYEWIYSPLHEHDLSVGQLAGYLLSDARKDYKTAEDWRKEPSICLGVLQLYEELLENIIHGKEAVEQLDGSQVRHYMEQLERKANNYPEGKEAWLETYGNLRKEMGRYMEALARDWGHEVDMLKALWILNYNYNQPEDVLRQRYEEMNPGALACEEERYAKRLFTEEPPTRG